MDKIAYLKGLLDGQGVDKDSKEGKVIFAVCAALEELVKYNEELEDRVAELEELCDILDEDLSDIEEQMAACDCKCDCDYCPEDVDDFDELEEQYETICPTCGQCILLDEDTLEEGETVCPVCGEELEFDFDESEIQALAPADNTEDED